MNASLIVLHIIQWSFKSNILLFFVLFMLQDVLLIFKDIDNRASAQPSASFGSHNAPLPLVHVNVL